MPTPLTRKLYDSRNVRAFGAQLRQVDLSTALAGRFEETLADLAITEAQRALADRDRYSEEQRREINIVERNRVFDVRELNRALAFAPPNTPEHESIRKRLEDYETGYEGFMSEQTRISIAEGRLRTPEELTEQYGYLDLTFDLPMTQGEADILAENKKAEQIRRALIDYGPQGALPGIAQFGTGVLAAMVDPLELATAFIPFVGQGTKIAALARLSEVGRRTAIGAANGFVGSVVTEPGYYMLSKSQQLDYTMTDALFNVGVGTILGGGIGTVSGLYARSKSGNLPTEGEIEIENPVTPIPDEPFTETYYMPAPKNIGGERIDGEPEPRMQSNAERTSQQEAANLALTQNAMGEQIDIGVTITPTPKRPMTLSEYVASKGGIQSTKANPGQLVIYSPSGRTAQKMAKMAKKAGFIKKESAAALNKALAANSAGRLVYSNKAKAQKELAEWRAFWKEEDETGKIYEEYLAAVKSFPAGTSIIKMRQDIQKQIDEIDKMPKMGKFIARLGGLNEKAWSDAAGMNKKESGRLTEDFGKPFWRAKDKGLTPDQLAERLVESGYIREYDANEAIDFVDDLLRVGDRVADVDEAARLADLELSLDQLSRLDDEGLDDFLRVYIQDIEKEYGGDIQAFIDAQRILKENEAIGNELNKYGFADLTIDEISRIGTLMAQKDLTLDQAAKQVGIDLQGEKAKRIAQQRIDRTNRMLGESPEAYAEIEAAAEINQGTEAILARYRERFPDSKATSDEDFSNFDVEDLNSAIVEYDDIINDYRASGDISPEEAAYLDELGEIDQYANDYDDAATIASSCIARP